ncbi:MOSC N-terminal beta barrel domain-containing protein, partial [Streptomyces griseorubiginosus]|uniref:MOSC N-terminal beta barrel domain-containing protein n=1 Tax=Streptomyces griseorubiginosus TaxID=67304 RepID=UPI0036541F88
MGNAELLSIHVHPVKAFRGLAPREAEVEPWGLAGDRRWALVDDGGKVVTQRQQPRLALAAAPREAPGRRIRAAPRPPPYRLARAQPGPPRTRE